ncbi:MAG: hypothetical protein ABTQ32_12960 [Myxococcaceae bacterium]
MTTLLLSVLLAASTDEVRLEPRLHTAIGPALTVGRSDWSIGYGLGLSADLGVVLQDLLVLTSRLTWGTTLQRDAGTLGLSVDLLLGERWSVGGGLAFGYIGSLAIADYSRAWSFAFPLRVQVGLLGRPVDEAPPCSSTSHRASRSVATRAAACSSRHATR